VLGPNQVLRQYGERQAYLQEYRHWHYRASATAQAGAYRPDRQATDCYYWGKDEPGLHDRFGQPFTHDVTLTGFLIDTCNGKKVLKRTMIHFVRAGTAGFPATYGPPTIAIEGDQG
jgi:hypothetical protein